MEPFFYLLVPLEVNDRRENRSSEQENQPLEVVPRQETGEMQDEDRDCQHIKQSKQHRVFPFFCSATGIHQPLFIRRCRNYSHIIGVEMWNCSGLGLSFSCG